MVHRYDAHALSLCHHHVCDCKPTVCSVPICLCTIFHTPVAIHGPQTESIKTIFFTTSQCFLFYFLQIIYLQKFVFATTAHTISGPYTLYDMCVCHHSTHHIRPLYTVRYVCLPPQHTPYQALIHCKFLMSRPPQNFTFLIFSHPWF